MLQMHRSVVLIVPTIKMHSRVSHTYSRQCVCSLMSLRVRWRVSFQILFHSVCCPGLNIFLWRNAECVLTVENTVSIFIAHCKYE